ncbi:protein SUPPRESSOR OF GENE SILENCING 3 [Andrographis paniculata]|uniref:protein SUPPRESSOR OF GENE SILENCING 3 n=1 Tax=Andrographis paniculata TaxID=175694 RepID=UPI0021E805F7|nr:protein SUPPRESSOR OF GENE SILENCING 3 [Andrographis paniculata]XP_051129568.1 protein SUPPRESSOR OF GENE SILENCING 3 [Andrographis paniculata]XP_051129569.1 protein SUPPRESSOR OF GENE SILENCING 3 [Andrographis paniculata]XP_051129570.1 protein SUPPRESSOR OF GENE SILENCING 3 [Andrographis paniculata]XP_051129571.1 protein SUPPRESSOR OF GENE SILENCING 3 [Andrographis paniculata]XP_051129572.1 protein SUPPRESSOR OF GENE SILENCING 3 [Andrographis paniculata]
MSSSRRDGASDFSNKGKSISTDSNNGINQLAINVSDMSLDSAQGEGWEVYGKKGKNKIGSNSFRQGGPQYPTPKAWGQADTVQRLGLRNQSGYGRGSGQTWQPPTSDSRKTSGRGYAKPPQTSDSSYVAAPAVIPPPLKNGWGWSSRAPSSQESIGHNAQEVYSANDEPSQDVEDDLDEDSDAIVDSDDDLSDGFDSDDSRKSHDTRKQNSWFKELFQSLDILTVEQINDPERQWHCPACKGGPGAIDWYRGLQPLITHAKTKRSKRVKLHRELAELLEEELRRRGTSAVPAGEMFGQWRGLQERDREIVWPPMVIIMNTRLEKGDNDKWIGMGNKELLEYFGGYEAVKARHSYGPQGHRGISVLIFEASAVGYAHAERLGKHFVDNGRDRQAWDRTRTLFYAGGRRQLYGFMAEKHDMENFNLHCQGKTKLKYDMQSYHEMVVKQMKQMSEDNQQLIFLKNKVMKEQKHKKALEESLVVMSEKYRRTAEENRVVKLRTQKHHDLNKEEMDSQEQFFREQIQSFYNARNAKEEKFEKTLQAEREKMTMKSQENVSSEEQTLRDEEIAKFIKSQDEQMVEFGGRRDALMKKHQERILEMKRRHMEEEVAAEKEFDVEFNKLIEEYAPGILK